MDAIVQLITAGDPKATILAVILLVYLVGRKIYAIWSKKRKQQCADCDMRLKALSYDTMEEQMSGVEDALTDIRREAMEWYRKKSAGMERPQTEAETWDDAYQRLLDGALQVGKDRIRYFFKRNHFAELTDAEFRAKANERIEAVLAEAMETMFNQFPRHARPNYKDLEEGNEAFVLGVKARLQRSFDDARQDAIESKEEAKRIKSHGR